MRTTKGKQVTAEDRAEVEKFKVYLKRRATLPDEPVDVAYAEVYGEVVFEDKSESGAV